MAVAPALEISVPECGLGPLSPPSDDQNGNAVLISPGLPLPKSGELPPRACSYQMAGSFGASAHSRSSHGGCLPGELVGDSPSSSEHPEEAQSPAAAVSPAAGADIAPLGTRQPASPPAPPPKPAPKPQAKAGGGVCQRFTAQWRRGLAAMNAMATAGETTETTMRAVLKGKDRGPEKVHLERQAALQRVEEVIRKTPWLLPDSRLRRLWDTVMLLTALVQVIIAPLLVVGSVALSPLLQGLFWTLSVMNAMDALVRYNTALIRNEELVMDRRFRLRHYMRHWFALDILTVVPFDCIALLLGASGLLLQLSSLPHVLRFFHADVFFHLSNPGAIDPDYVRFYFNWVPGFKFIFYFAFGIHVLAVTKIALADDYDESDPDTINDRRYDYCLFWVWNLLTTSPAPLTLNSYGQRVFCFCLMCGGVIFQGIIVGQVSLLLLKSGVRQQNEAKMRTTLDIVTHYNLPTSLKQEVLSMQWHALQSSLNFLSNAGAIFDRLPALMRNEINIYIKIDFISKCAMFAEARHQTKIRLASCLRQEFREPGEKVIVAGDVGSEMYFILHGFCEVLIEGVGCVAVVKRGDFFGEVALLVDTARTATIRTLTYCDFFVLHREPFSKICDGDPLFHSAIREKMHGKLPPDKHKQNRLRWRLAKNIVMLSRAGGNVLGQPATGARDAEGSEDKRSEVSSLAQPESEDGDNMERMVHEMALQCTQQERERKERVANLLSKAMAGRQAQTRRRSVPMKIGNAFQDRLAKIRGQLQQQPAKEQSPPQVTSAPPSPPQPAQPSDSPRSAGAVMQRLVGSPVPKSPRSPLAAVAARLTSPGAPPSTREEAETGSPSAISMRSRSARQMLKSAGSARNFARQADECEESMRSFRGLRPSASPPAAAPGGGSHSASQYAVMSTEDKVNVLLERVDTVLAKQQEQQASLDQLWHGVQLTGSLLEDLSERHEQFGDDVFAALNKVEEQTWTVQDLVGHALERLPDSREDKGGKVTEQADFVTNMF